MKLRTPRVDDVVVFDRSGTDIRVGGVVNVYEVQGERRLTLREALDLGHERARRLGVGLWLERGKKLELIEDYGFVDGDA